MCAAGLETDRAGCGSSERGDESEDEFEAVLVEVGFRV
jgi:hypothetical protein